MCRTSNGLWILALIAMAVAALMLVALFAPNEHVRERHPEAVAAMSDPLEAFKCWSNGEMRLYVQKPITGCPNDINLGVITTEQGDTVTSFFAKWKHWLKVIIRDGYSVVQ